MKKITQDYRPGNLCSREIITSKQAQTDARGESQPVFGFDVLPRMRREDVFLHREELQAGTKLVYLLKFAKEQTDLFKPLNPRNSGQGRRF